MPPFTIDGLAQHVGWTAEPWSAQNHELFPSKERERVPGYLLVGRQLSARAPRSGGALWDCWMSHVMAFAVDRN